jgi:hypothetical protein
MCKTIHTENQISPQYVGSSVIRQSRYYIGFKVLFDPCGVDGGVDGGADGCTEEEGSLSLLHASTQF